MNLDMDLYDTLQQERITPPPAAATLEGTRQLLGTECRRAGRARRSRHPAMRWAVPLAGVTFLAGAGAAAWAITWTDPTTSTTFECGNDTYIPVESGNPIADCHNALAKLEPVVPQLEGWITASGLVAVLPVGDAPPVGSTRLPAGFSVNRSVLYVGDVLGDEAQPMATTCTTTDSAAAYARSQLELADLAGWDVQVRPTTGTSGAPLGSTTSSRRASGLRTQGGDGGSCTGYTGYLDPTSRTAYLLPVPLSAAGSVDVQLDERLRTQLVSGASPACDTSAQAAALVRNDASELGIATADYSVSVAGGVGTSSHSCALVTIDPGGSIQATIWQVPPA
jgi:hypothetical protein